MIRYRIFFVLFILLSTTLVFIGCNSNENEQPVQVREIQAKAKRIYKNSKGYWEAEFDYDIVMVYIPPGEFQMGSPESEMDRKENEGPVHSVYLDGYWLGKHEVTVGQYKIFVSDTGYHTEAEKGDGVYVWTGKEYEKKKNANWKNPYFSQNDYHPVSCVSWNDAREFCKWISKKTGLNFHLPTEAQWEKAARGASGLIYPWGNNMLDGSRVNFADSSTDFDWKDKSINDGYKYSAPVGSYSQGESPYGCLDMAGNVWEWCSDWYSSDYYKKSPYKNPGGPSNGSSRVVRGGSWGHYASHLRCAFRADGRPSARRVYTGFRLSQD